MARAETFHRSVSTIVAGDFDQGTSYTNWRPRGSGDWLLVYTVEGKGMITLGGAARELSAGQAVLYSPQAEQDYRTDERAGRWSLLWAHFNPRPNWRAWMRWPEAGRGVGFLTLPEGDMRKNFAAALLRAVTTLRSPHGNAVEFALNAFEEALLWAQQAVKSDALSPLDERVRKGMDYLAANTSSAFRMDAVAVHCGLSESRFSHLFKTQTGETPQRYSEELRLLQAQQLLAHSSLRIHEVAAETGFTDPFYFAKRFRKFAGASPSDFRKSETRA